VSGPTYSTLNNNGINAYQNQNGTYSRWATFKIAENISSKSAVRINIINSNITGLPTSDMSIYVTVINNGSQVIGWIDANSAYNGSGSPSASGDAACVITNSSATYRYVTFGPTTRSGDVYVRIGFPSGSTKQFGSVTYTST
jgi:hypothetical protein